MMKHSVSTTPRTYIGETSYTGNTWGRAVLVHPDILKAITLIPINIQTVFVASLLNSCSPLTSSIEGGGHYE